MTPLYEGDPRQTDGIPGLMNNVKMMHTIARYYSTSERMTTLFKKISNQMIVNMREYITAPGNLWWTRIERRCWTSSSAMQDSSA